MEQLVADHPYFSAARLLLARKVYQQTGDLQSIAVKKALLYTNQHHYAYQVITAEQQLMEVENRVAPVIPEDSLPEEIVTQPGITASIVDEIAAAEVLPVVEDRIPVIIPEETEEEEIMTVEDTIATAEPVTEEEEEVITGEEATPFAIADFEPVAVEETTAPDVAPPVIQAAAEPAPEATIEDNGSQSGPIKIFPMALGDTEETELIFQPLYTDDYFAYKRLKNPEEADDLNEQGAAEMKSFTSWLRQMKDNFVGKTSKDWYQQQLHRIYEEDDEPEVSETVEKMAMDSIVFNNDIVSETLAEIWVRQHQYSNAIKIYQKLSLLNPDKNAYFAQKILALKSQTDKK